MARSSSPAIGCSTERPPLRRRTHSRARSRSSSRQSRPEHARRRACPSALSSWLAVWGSDWLAVIRGGLSPETPRAQEGDKKGSPSLLAITSGLRVLRVEILTPDVAEGPTLRLARGAAGKSQLSAGRPLGGRRCSRHPKPEG